MCDASQVLRPIPRRTFEISPASNECFVPPSPTPESANAEPLDAKLHGASPDRTRSVLNLTSSTLLGIYSSTTYDVSREQPATPWGTGAQTPHQRHSGDGPRVPSWGVDWDKALPQAAFDRRKPGFRGLYFSLLLRGMLLFLTGVAYGTLITHLHDKQKLAPVNVKAFDRQSWSYIMFWGWASIALGTLQLWVDSVWSNSTASTERPGSPIKRRGSYSSTDGDVNGERPCSGADWMPVVRIVGAFVGIVFAIVGILQSFPLAVLIMAVQRKLPWQSTLQLSLTLALVNLVLWYLIDRTKPGFILSAVVGIVGTFALLEINPDIVPSTAIRQPKVAFASGSSPEALVESFISQESIGVWTWIASVLFCSCACFGSICRRLALSHRNAVS